MSHVTPGPRLLQRWRFRFERSRINLSATAIEQPSHATEPANTASQKSEQRTKTENVRAGRSKWMCLVNMIGIAFILFLLLVLASDWRPRQTGAAVAMADARWLTLASTLMRWPHWLWHWPWHWLWLTVTLTATQSMDFKNIFEVFVSQFLCQFEWWDI